MRTSSFCRGDSGDSGDKATFTASRRVPTAETSSGHTGDNITTRRRVMAKRTVPTFQYRIGDTRKRCVYWDAPTVPSCPHQKQIQALITVAKRRQRAAISALTLGPSTSD
jgi:hypothetical protein